MLIQFKMIALFFLQWRHGHCSSNINDLPNTAMIMEGDLNLGAIIHFLAHSVNPVCGNFTPHPVLHQVLHAFVYGVGMVNNDSRILPNVSLGYVLLDDCTRVIPTIPRALQLLPLSKPEYQTANVLSFGSSYDVVGIVGPYNSEPNLVVASMTGFFEMPQISPYASSDALSDKTRFPYFFRTISPDKLILKATVSFAKQIGWEYISVIYSEDEFGYNANKFVRKYAEEEGLCVEESYPVDTDYDSFDYGALLDHISGPKVRSKVFITYVINSQADFLIRSLPRLRKDLNIILFFSQCTALPPMRFFFKSFLGSIQITAEPSDSKDFNTYYKHSVTPWLRPDDPWVKTLWEQQYGCKMNPSDTEKPCRKFTNMFDFPPAPGQIRNVPAGNAMRMADAVQIFALALDNLIKGECPDAVGNKSALRMCVKSNLLKDYLSKVELKSEKGAGVLKFDENQDGVRRYVFKQIQSHPRAGYLLKVIAVYNPNNKNDSIKIFEKDLQWPLNSKLNDEGKMESVCSYPCVKGEIYIQGDVKCCWTCHKCRENEITSNNFSLCLPCPVLQWPSKDNLIDCLPIKPSFLSWSHMYGIGMTTLSCTGIMGSVIITFILIRNRDCAVVRGSNKELMGIILAGAFTAYLTIPSFIVMPTDNFCLISRTGFSISCTLLFAPLLVKSVRMFRIFKASANFKTNIRFVSVASQLVIICILLLIQVAATVATGYIWRPYAELSMPIKTEKYVELQCDLNMYGIIIPLGYNIFLAFLCAICGFITRKLPDNFNESWYIFVSICTTLFIWTAFLPTYFAAFYAFHKAVLLALALYLNSSITVICLFGPKIYAVYFTEESDIQVSNFKGRRNKMAGSHKERSTEVSNIKESDAKQKELNNKA